MVSITVEDLDTKEIVRLFAYGYDGNAGFIPRPFRSAEKVNAQKNASWHRRKKRLSSEKIIL